LEEGDNPQDAVRTYEAMLPTIQDPTELLSVQLKLGKLYMLIEGGAARAKEYLSDALAINPDADEPQSLLKEVLQELMDWDALIALLEQEFDGLTDKRRQADLAHEVARIYRDRLEDDEGTYRWLRVAVDAKRDHRGAVEDLVDYLIAREEWADSEPLLAWLVSYLEAKRKYRALSPRAEQLAKVYQRLGDNAQALTYYKVACQSDSQNASIALAYGRLLYETERYDRALQTLQGLLVLQHDIKDEAIKIDMFLYLAKVSIAVSDKSKARRHLKRLLAIAPEHTEGSVLLKKL
jgi:Tfp pilus assembly protein PilF